jgi:DNA-directed RNA polymerase specialized sigma24 family protein
MKSNQIDIEPRSNEAIEEFNRRFRSYLRRLYRIALILTGRPQSAQDMLTAIYFLAFESYPRKTTIQSFENWLKEILQNYLESRSYQSFCLIESGLTNKQHSIAGLIN